MNPIPYNILFGKKGIAMSNLRIRQNLMRTRRRKVIWDSRSKGLNPQD
jgi:hypothetical protein